MGREAAVVVDPVPAASQAREGSARPQFRWCLGALVGLVAISQGIFALVWRDQFLADDWFWIYSASQLHGIPDLIGSVLFQSRWFDRATEWVATYALFQVAGPRPLVYHLAAQLLDLVNALLLGLLSYHLLASLRPTAGRHLRILAAGLVTVLFLFNHRHHEVVFWYASLNESLAAFFRISMLVLVISWLRQPRVFFLVWPGVLLCTLLACLSKESGVVAPLEVGLLYAVVSARPRRQQLVTAGTARRIRLLLGSQVTVVALWCAVYALAGGIGRGGAGSMSLVRANPLDLLLRVLIFINDDYFGLRRLFQGRATLAIELLLWCVALWLAVRRRQRLWIFALLWTVICILPYAIISGTPGATVYQLGTGADRYLYTMSAGASLLVVASLFWLHDEFGRNAMLGRFRPVGALAVGLLLLSILGADATRLVSQARQWQAASAITNAILVGVDVPTLRPRAGDALCFVNVPDMYEQKYVFLNGLPESLYLAAGNHDFSVLRAPAIADLGDTGRCTAVFQYDAASRTLRRTAPP